jgi:gliding motility-associated-like protein
MKNFEDQLKDAFDGYEPEAPSSVWNHVQQSIKSPAAPAAATKVITAKLGWIAAAVITTGIAVTLLVVKPWASKNNTSLIPIVPVKSEVNTSIETTETPSNDKLENTAVTPSVTPDGYNPSSEDKITENRTTSEKSAQNNTTTSVVNTDVAVVNSNQNVSTSNKVVSNSALPKTNTTATTNNNTSKAISIQNQEIANLFSNTKTGFAPLNVTFVVNTGANTDIDFGDGSTAFKTSSTTHKFTKPGVYEVKCLLNNVENIIKITVLNDLGSAFSPNADGINDNFVFGGDNIRDLTVNIYDRSGKRVYSGNTNNCMWDGTLIDGQKAETGTYFYDIFATTVEGENFKQKGAINLFR